VTVFEFSSNQRFREIAPGTFLCGRAFLGNCLLEDSEFARLAGLAVAKAKVSEFFQSLNGFFAFVARKATGVVAAVDRVRSIPIFYKVASDSIIVAAHPSQIPGVDDLTELDPEAAAEFLLTGYVTGSQTLFRTIRQLQAGEILIGTPHASGPIAKVLPYYRYIHRDGLSPTVDEFKYNLGQVFSGTIQRLMQYAGGRPIVLPLSGGLDSRLLAVGLRQAGYPHVLAFTYGALGNTEAAVSRDVARQLKIPWSFAEYSPRTWETFIPSSEWLEYAQLASNYTSVPHCQDWPAIKDLVKQNFIPANSVMVPGHSADFLAGSHIPNAWDRQRRGGYNAQKVLQAVSDYHHVLHFPGDAFKATRFHCDEPISWALGRIAGVLPPFPDAKEFDLSCAVDIFELWDWQERQAKFIVNSVRVYDYFQLDWWLPLWDGQFVDFWQQVPIELRLRKRLYNSFVHNVAESVGLNIKPASEGPLTLARSTLKALVPAGLVGALRRSVQRLPGHATARHPLAWHTLKHPHGCDRLPDRGGINSILAAHTLAILGC
jgi:asparagine synthase (glutamine-hydrolysing)